MAALYRLSNRAAVGLALLGTLGILLMVVHVTLDVVLRSTLSVSIPATVELVTRYYLITLALLPLGWVEWRRGMIAVEALEGVMGQRLVRFSDVLVSLLSAVVYAVLAIATWDKAMEQYAIGSYVMSLNFPMPVWPTYFVLPIAFALAAVVCVVRVPFLARGAAHPAATPDER
ncbi:TRAP transporter small permease [Halomonas heilongjiangensis]|uniref:TRAP transporter small permease protein n=1 Tax=Halomonas heilongjiangensis TaxID=1387883 RepID=A0A2N7TH01_9GAMM|nr:TRAP transporter small permease [Halomonas heilongjiangensis]PMR67457.1 TRAP transporter small permease [Halomonas heilongjiangensis]PXX87099.1 C4-dicarboxylate ABC transporter permease [Halomonas heilongjiangensis]